MRDEQGVAATTGGPGDDSITGTGGADALSGDAGDDQLSGGAGDDVLDGGTGDDLLLGGDGGDVLSGGGGSDTLVGGAGDDVFPFPLEGDGVVTDFRPGDTIAPLIPARDIEVARDGTYTVLRLIPEDAGVPDDVMVLVGDYAGTFRLVRGADGQARIVYDPPAPVTPETSSSETVATAGGPTVTVTHTGGGVELPAIGISVTTAPAGSGTAIVSTAIVSLVPGLSGTSFDVGLPAGLALTAHGPQDAHVRGAVASTLYTELMRLAPDAASAAVFGAAAERFLGSLDPDGRVVVRTATPTGTTAAGAVLAFGAADTATVKALVLDARGLPASVPVQVDGVGLTAVAGAAVLTGGAGDNLWAGDGTVQTMHLGAGADTAYGGGGADRLYGNTDADALYGNQGADVLFGGQGGDTLFGGQDGDALYGNRAADVLYGQLGDDTLDGGAGADTLWGGAGADQFRIDAATEGGDTVADFTSGVDRLAVLGPSFGNPAAGTLPVANFALNNPADADDLFVFNTATGVLSFDADGSGAGAAVAIATLNVRTLGAADILVLPG